MFVLVISEGGGSAWYDVVDTASCIDSAIVISEYENSVQVYCKDKRGVIVEGGGSEGGGRKKGRLGVLRGK